MSMENPKYPNFLDREDSSFTSFLLTLDNLFKSLQSDGVGAESAQTKNISNEEESLLWSSGVINVETPKGLLQAVFYFNGKCFCLRGGQEHRDLGVSQLQRLYKPERYLYSEIASKNRPGGKNQSRFNHKTVTVVANPYVGIRCHVFILNKYLSKVPNEAIEKDLFYCKPLPEASNNDQAAW